MNRKFMANFYWSQPYTSSMGMLRILLALSVFMDHVPQSTFNNLSFSGFGGANAVEMFFVISGFYIAWILDKSYSTKLGFYKNRALRLYPVYFIICLLVLVRCAFLPNIRAELFSYPSPALILGTIANLTFFGSDWLTFLSLSASGLHFGAFSDSFLQLRNMLLVPQSWSLGIEVAFYLLAPILCKAKTRTLIACSVLMLAVRTFFAVLELTHNAWTYRFFPFELPLFLLGILLYRMKSTKNPQLRFSGGSVYSILIFFFLAFPIILEKLSISRFFQLALLFILVSIVILFAEENPWDRKLGELSYPIYMSHVLVIGSFAGLMSFLSERIPVIRSLSNPGIGVVATLALTIVLSLILLRVVKPIERIRDGNRK